MVQQNGLAPSGSESFCVNHLTDSNHSSIGIPFEMRVMQLLATNTGSTPSNIPHKNFGVLCLLFLGYSGAIHHERFANVSS